MKAVFHLIHRVVGGTIVGASATNEVVAIFFVGAIARCIDGGGVEGHGVRG